MIQLANMLHRSLVIPPYKCGRSGPYCNLCKLYGKKCAQDSQKRAILPIKESVVLMLLFYLIGIFHK